MKKLICCAGMDPEVRKEFKSIKIQWDYNDPSVNTDFELIDSEEYLEDDMTEFSACSNDFYNYDDFSSVSADEERDFD